MKKGLLVIFSLIMTLLLFPGGMASWGGDLFIGGTVTTGEFLEDEEPAEEPEIITEETKIEKIIENGQDSGEIVDDGPVDDESAKEDKKNIKPEPRLSECVLTISTSGHGDTTLGQGSFIYKQGQEVELIARPAKGWIFDKWLIGESKFSDPELIIVINNDIRVEAVFIEADSGSENEEVVEGKNGDNGDFGNGNDGGEETSDQEDPQVNSGDQDGALQ